MRGETLSEVARVAFKAANLHKIKAAVRKI